MKKVDPMIEAVILFPEATKLLKISQKKDSKILPRLEPGTSGKFPNPEADGLPFFPDHSRWRKNNPPRTSVTL